MRDTLQSGSFSECFSAKLSENLVSIFRTFFTKVKSCIAIVKNKKRSKVVSGNIYAGKCFDKVSSEKEPA